MFPRGFALLPIVTTLALACGDDDGATSTSGQGGAGGEAIGGAGGAAGAGGQSSEPPFPLPVLRFGPRSTFCGAFRFPITGTIRVPASASTLDFDAFEVFGHGATTGLAIEAPVTDGDQLVAAFSAELATCSVQPALDREIFSAFHPARELTLLAVLDDAGELHFDFASTALQVASLARPVPPAEDDAFFEVHAFGARPGDDAALDAPSLAAEALLLEAFDDDAIVVGHSGFPVPGTELFALLSQAFDEGEAPTIVRPSGAFQLGIAQLGSADAPYPLVHSSGYGFGPIAPGYVPIEGSFSFFLYSVPQGPSESHFLRMRRADGRTTLPSAPFVEIDAVPLEPVTLVRSGEVLEACGGTPGRFVVFQVPTTELAVGFAAPVVEDDGCARLPVDEVPTDAFLVSAYQVDVEGRTSSPSESVVLD
jgi:hypothetical protein